MSPRRQVVTLCAMYGAASIAVFPLILMAITAFRPDADLVAQGVLSIPSRLSLDGVAEAWRAMAGDFIHSMMIAGPAVVVSVALGALCGAALAARRGWLARLLWCLLVLALFIPPQVILYPMIVVTRALGVFGSLTGLILVHTIWGLPLTTLLFRNYFATLPSRVVDAAQIDGAGFFYFFTRIAAPMAAPVIVIATTLQFTYVWNDMLLGVTFGGRDAQPITVALAAFGGGQFGPQHPGLTMAAALVAALPPLALYVAAAGLLTSRPSSGVAP